MSSSREDECEPARVWSQLVRLRCGLRLHLRRSGAGAKACLLLHGYGLPVEVWDDLLARLPDDITAIAVQFRGHGRSDWDPAQRYDVGTSSGDVLEVAQQLGVSRFVLVGHSLGGQVALRLVEDAPESVLALALLDTGPELAAAGLKRIRECARSLPPSFLDVFELRRWLARVYPFAPPAALELIERHGASVLDDGRTAVLLDPAFQRVLWHAQAFEAGAPARDPGWSALARVRAPALVVRGAYSAVLTREVAWRMARTALLYGRFAEVPAAGHALLVDNAPGCSDVLVPFISANARAADTGATAVRAAALGDDSWSDEQRATGRA